jgi:acyl-CoA reductase-like NAD-dependent aldehyde dehydrogenase
VVDPIDYDRKSWHIGVEGHPSSPSIEKHSPLTDQKIAEFFVGRDTEITSLVVLARDTQDSWAGLTFSKRGDLLREACKLLEAKSEVISQVVHLETGKSLGSARSELGAAIDFGYLMAAHGRLPIGSVLPSAIPGKDIYVTREPHGVCALICSFNTPLPNYAWKTFPALISGNTAILKPSPHTPFSSALFGETLLEAGIPAGVFNVIQGDSLTGKMLLNSEIDLVSFTGSNEVGKVISKVASERLIRTILELGGSNPFVVFDDADLANSVDFAIQSGFSNSGQRCAAGSRLLLHKSIAEKFLDMLQAKFRDLKFGVNHNAFVGPVISPKESTRLKTYLDKCQNLGAKLFPLGILDGMSQSVVQPHLVTGLDPLTEHATKEIFGPIVRVFTFQTDAEAISLANSTKLGLTAAIWTQDSERARRVANQISAGLVNINGPTHGAEPNVPFGGIKSSGNGSREAGVECLNFYSEIKVISRYHQNP